MNTHENGNLLYNLLGVVLITKNSTKGIMNFGCTRNLTIQNGNNIAKAVFTIIVWKLSKGIHSITPNISLSAI